MQIIAMALGLLVFVGLWAFVATELIGSALQAFALPSLRDPREPFTRL